MPVRRPITDEDAVNDALEVTPQLGVHVDSGRLSCRVCGEVALHSCPKAEGVAKLPAERLREVALLAAHDEGAGTCRDTLPRVRADHARFTLRSLIKRGQPRERLAPREVVVRELLEIPAVEDEAVALIDLRELASP